MKPAPDAYAAARFCPALMRPSRTAMSSASGIEAAEVLPWSATVTITLSMPKPSFFAVASMMRMLAWCGTSQSIVGTAQMFSSSTSSTTSLKHLDGKLEHRLAFHRDERMPLNGRRAPFPAPPECRDGCRRRAACWRQMPGVSAGLQYHRARAIAEQHAGGAIFPVQNARQHFRADHQRVFGLAAA